MAANRAGDSERSKEARRAAPLGVFDSGLGGLTVVRALRALCPHESIVYLGDNARVPYGTRSAETVIRYASTCAAELAKRGVATRSLNFLKNPAFGISFMVVVGTRDAMDRNQARDVFRIVANTENAEEVEKNSNARGTDLLGNPALATEVDIVRFLDENLRELDIPWETRISRYDR